MVHIKIVFQGKIVNELDGINAHFILYEPITLYNLILLKISTIGLAVNKNPVGVVLGGILYVSLRICISNEGFSIYT